MRDDTSNPPAPRPDDDEKKDAIDAYCERRARVIELLQQYAARQRDAAEREQAHALVS